MLNDLLNRRSFQQCALGALAGTVLGSPGATGERQSSARAPKTFRLWAMGDSHVGTDKKRGRESLADALRQSEQGGADGGPAFEWDIAVHVGDLSGNQGAPTDDEGEEVVRQYAVLREHRREDIYDLAGNHDASTPGQPTQWWFRKWADPTGENTRHSGVDASRRKFPVTGTWERYSFRVGNLLFLIMSDRNDGGPPVGRTTRGGYPAGAVTGETFDWWKENVERHSDANVICAHHHMLKETTVASGPWEGFTKTKEGKWQSHYHGYFPDGGPEGASYLYFVDGKPDARSFEKYLAAHEGAISLWLGGHTHTNPADRTGGRSHIERKWGATFINCAALSRYHASKTTLPMSRLLTFTTGSRDVLVQCYLHTNQFAPQGWYRPAERTIQLNHPFELT
jgi:hypothetical protein